MVQHRYAFHDYSLPAHGVHWHSAGMVRMDLCSFRCLPTTNQ
nr:MAG TPA: hypothetical protein [Caudoviricetes sp.]